VIALRLRSAIPLNALETESPDGGGDPSSLLSLHPEDRVRCRVKKVKREKKAKEGDAADPANDESEIREIGELDYCQMINRSVALSSLL
jgi:hypothetical protein